MTLLGAPWHLVKRFVGSVTAAPLTDVERTEVAAVLLPTEHRLFEQFSVADQRHALHVLRRFDSFAPGAPVFARRAALLHDIGKVDAQLGTLRRVVATVVGPRTPAFRRYHQHEVHAPPLADARSRRHVPVLHATANSSPASTLPR